MIRVVIVDDEKYSRQMIQLLGDWTRWNMEIVGEARNGEEALDLVAKLKPDLMIIDMNMPVVDGASLLLHLRDNSCKFIVVSGYDDFHYTKHAIVHKVIDYLLKPISRNELNEALQKAVEEINHKDRNQKLTELRKLIGQTLWSDPFNIPRHCREMMEVEEEGWSDIQVHLVIVKNFHEICFNKFSGDSNLFMFMMENVLGEILGQYGQAIVVPSLLGKCEFVVVIKSYLSDIYMDHNQMISYLNETFALDVILMNSEKFSNPQNIPVQYNLLKEKFLQGPYTNIITNSGQKSPPEILLDSRVLLRELEISIYNFNQEKSSLIINNWLNYYCYHPNLSVSHVFTKFADLMRVLRMMKEIFTGYVNDNYNPAQLHVFFEIGLSKNTLSDYLHTEVDTIIKKVIEQTDKSEIDQVGDFLKEHFTEDISLDDLCQRFHYSKTYLCKVFKKKYGCTVNDFVTDLKMRTAKKLLVEQGYLVHEAAELVGVKDYSYFSKLYKKHFGYPPSEDVRT
ncbi:response regulator [Paenibacillus elgii]